MPQRIATSVSWAANDAGGTEKVVTGLIEESHGAGDAVIFVHNPSIETALTVTPRVRLTDGAGTRRVAVLGGTEFSVPANSTEARKVSGLIGIPDVAMKNASLVTAGFTAEVVIQFAS